MPNDTYTIHYGSLHKGTFNIEKSQPNIYCDQMVEIIDNEIETVSK